MTCRAIEQMLKRVEEQAREQTHIHALKCLYQTGRYSLSQIFEALEIPEEKREEYTQLVLADEINGRHMQG